MCIAVKGPVGQRLAWAARALAYGENIPFKNPALQSATLTTSDSDSQASMITLKFDVPVELRKGHVGFFDASIKPYSKAWLTVSGVNATALR